jgi:hypothetical protein
MSALMLKGSDINGINKYHYIFIRYTSLILEEIRSKEGRISREDEVFW